MDLRVILHHVSTLKGNDFVVFWVSFQTNQSGASFYVIVIVGQIYNELYFPFVYTINSFLKALGQLWWWLENPT